jgi:hypothetical protein
MSLWKAFGTDEQMEVSGVPIKPAGFNADGTEATFFVARIGGQNHQFTKIRDQIMRPYSREIEAGTLDPQHMFRLNVEVFVKANLKGWQHVRDIDEQEIRFSYDNAIKLLTQLPDLYLTLAYEAGKIANYQAIATEAAEKN